ncbi:MAG: TonB-dependent receptor, partial [Erythrobacter sp.]
FFSIRGDRDNFEATLEQYRGVIGVRGDMPFIAPSWSFELAGVYSRSEGTSSRVGVRSDRLALALGYDPTQAGGIELRAFGNPVLPGGPCDVDNLSNPENAQPDLAQGCVPVNLFADSINEFPFGSFATDAERDYLFDERNFDTTYEQKLISGFVTGDLFELPAGPVGAVIGAEWREDSIDSQPDAVAAEGLLFGFFSDQGATGSKSLFEVFGEVSLPLVAGEPLVEELNVDIAGRMTDEEFYGTNYTYSIKGGWRPVPALLLRMTYGTSFRAPNLRENFLRGQTGFLSLTDPCAVPADAFFPLGVGYDPTQDERDEQILANCRREGRDPTRVGINPAGQNTQNNQSVEIATGGSLDIDPETSRSITAGFSFEETFGDGFDVALASTYFDIKLKDSIIEPSSQFIVNDCFLREDGQRSPFCDRIEYDTDENNTRLLVSDINSGFINLNEESVRGIDFNAAFGKDVVLFGESLDLGLNFRANHLIERSTLFIDDLGQPDFDDDAGEISLPKWTGTGTFTADYDEFRFTYQVRYTGPVEQDPLVVDDFSDAFGNQPDGSPANVFGDTCLGAGSANGVVEGTGVFCRDVGFADEQFLHSASMRFRNDRMTLIVGVDNLFDTAPPQVDPGAVGLSISNTILGAGYDYDGREFFASVQYNF